MKNFTYFYILAALVAAPAVQAVENYTLLEPTVLLDNSTANAKTNFFTYVQFLFSTVLVMATVLSIFMLVIAGVEYIASGIPGAKSDAKRRINNALFGLGIALFAWLLLNTIDPAFVNFKIGTP